ncbi:uncharacterized protein EDB93DRAFT_1104035 [Suillus bovinus]|uniref:uncharacterized protein n=1 Tax=Suillus bovinus TaxID=48563 RepID=UPI001B8865EA|nr:uncharacterized protein EDB93DRAFT_1104035 [Suillus bovinus]KAG2147758.1 hypothetical protein EDB93DRAFT_1104035 [Suillus bovinus]
MESYIRSTVGLLVMLLRADGSYDYEFPITHDLMQALQNLELVLRERDQTTEKIHAVLTIVWITKLCQSRVLIEVYNDNNEAAFNVLQSWFILALLLAAYDSFSIKHRALPYNTISLPHV